MRRFGVVLFILISVMSVAFAQTVVHGKVYFVSSDLAAYSPGSALGHYVAIDGVVYDMTAVPAWSSGMHQGGEAGEDITTTIASAPHGKNVVVNLPAKGYLVRTFTSTELAQYNGTKNNTRYLAVSSVVYDLTNVPAWRNGSHQGGKAGTDITQRISGAPHGLDVLTKLPVVGFLIKQR
jgi:predicted heme/steroid binding protein